MGGLKKNPRRLVSETLVATKGLTKRKIARSISRDTPWLNPQQTELIIELLFETIAMGVIRDGFCELHGFGRFDLRDQVIPASTGIAPSLAGHDISLSDRGRLLIKRRIYKRVKRPHFQPDYRLKAYVNGVTPDILGQAQYRPKDWRDQLKVGLQRLKDKYNHKDKL